MVPRLILPPAHNVTAAVADAIEEALRMFRASLDAAVVDPPRPEAFLAASTAFQSAADELALQLGVKGADNPDDFKQAWWFNLWSAGMASTNITAENIRRQLECLNPSGLASQLALPFELLSDRSELERSLGLAVESVLKELWFFYSDTTLEGTKLNSRAQMYNAIDWSFGAGCVFSALPNRARLSGAENEDAEYQLWRYGIYRLVLQLLGYQPADRS
ncbi:MAG TPA: hypothetical protein VFT59_05165 [Candidatus Saccharimonadales bacterium]|nr:hypothetical protein [Candidatus Saccharimonadales bacterium]